VKLALLADLHIGFGYKKHSSDPRRMDSFENAAEALRLAVQNADAVLIAGDIFDRPNIDTDLFLRALEIFDVARSRDSGVSVNGETWKGVPVIAIRGNHDVSSDLHRHPVLLLDRAHRLKYINAEQVVLEKNGEKVAVTGAGWVPDRNAELVRRFFSERVPAPVPGAYNVLMLHQPLEGIGKYPGENPLPVSYLPPGFDVYHSGHLHWHVEKRVSDRWIVIPGSTVRTQLSDREVEEDRAIWVLDTESNELQEFEISCARRGFVRKVCVDNKGRDEVISEVVSAVESAVAQNDRQKEPIVKIVLEGSTYDVYDLSPIVQRYEGKAIVKIFDNTVSSVVEQLAEVASEGFGQEAAFSPAFAMGVLMQALESQGVEVGPEFDRFYRLLADAGRLSRPEEKEALLNTVERMLSEGRVFNLEKRPDRDKQPPRRDSSKSSILDWAGPQF